MTVLTELRNRGIQDAFIVCCDGLKGVPESARATWPLADVQTCVDLVRSATRLTSKKHWAEVCPELPEIHAAPPSRPPKTASPSSPRPAVTGFRPQSGLSYRDRVCDGCSGAAMSRQNVATPVVLGARLVERQV